MRFRSIAERASARDAYVWTLGVVLLAVLALALSGCGWNASHGEGEKIGQVVKFSRQGFINDTWEGQLIRGGLNSGSGGFGVTPFEFTVEGDELAKAVQAAMENQTEVIIRYRIEGIYSLFRSESRGHFLISIEPAANRGVKP